MFSKSRSENRLVLQQGERKGSHFLKSQSVLLLTKPTLKRNYFIRAWTTGVLPETSCGEEKNPTSLPCRERETPNSSCLWPFLLQLRCLKKKKPKTKTEALVEVTAQGHRLTKGLKKHSSVRSFSLPHQHINRASMWQVNLGSFYRNPKTKIWTLKEILSWHLQLQQTVWPNPSPGKHKTS